MAHLRHGFVQMRRGLVEHVRSGALTASEGSFFMWLVLEADPRTGFVYGSAGLFAAAYGWSDRSVREWLQGLEAKGYIRRFSKPGSHASYPILVNKYECTDGAMKGRRLNAVDSISCADPIYESCEESGEESVKESGEESVKQTARTLPQEERKRIRTKNDKEATPRFAWSLPDWVPKDAWDGYLEMRELNRAPLTQKAYELTIRSLEKLHAEGEDPGEVLDQSVKLGYRGLFAVRQEGGNGGYKSPAQKRTDANRDAVQAVLKKLRAAADGAGGGERGEF